MKRIAAVARRIKMLDENRSDNTQLEAEGKKLTSPDGHYRHDVIFDYLRKNRTRLFPDKEACDQTLDEADGHELDIKYKWHEGKNWEFVRFQPLAPSCASTHLP
jgi:hypothetical protein